MDTDEMTVVDESKAPSPVKKGSHYLTVMLTIVGGSEADFGKTFTFSENAIRIGRDKSSHVRLDDRKVSKRHCEISVIKTGDLEQIGIKDLRSTNGTYVNSELVRQRIMANGDKITVGETVIRFNYHDAIDEEYHSKLFNFAATDALTGLYNRRYILNELDRQHKIAKRNRRPYSIAILDIDDFKQVNDTYGHQAGDEYLRQVAFTINHTLREQDNCGRLGGEEFLVILPETDLEGAAHLANRIRERIEDAAVMYGGQSITSTVSAGVSQAHFSTAPTKEQTEGIDTLIQRADKALYDAKNSGKNKVVKAVRPAGA
jgi:diguanylate cyclase (GGDEF)-like protein